MENKRNFFRIAAVFALILCFLPLKAQKAQRYDNKYYMSLWGALGYANLLHNVPGTTPLGGVGGLFGAGFEYNHKRFILTFGAEFDYKNTTTRIKDFYPEYKTGLHHELGEVIMINDKPVAYGVLDTEGDPFVMLFDFSKYKENYHTMYVNFPLLMGGQFKTFYFLAGGKFGLFFGRESYTKTSYRTAGDYAKFIDIFENMPDHFFNDYTSKRKNDVKFGFNVVASMEMGKVFYPRKSKVHYRLAAFADYGVLNIHKNNILGPLVKFKPDMAHVVELTSSLSAERSRDKHVNPLLVGVKFTVLFDLGNKEPCQCIPEYKSKWKQK